MPRNPACPPRQRPSTSPSAIRTIGCSAMPHSPSRADFQLYRSHVICQLYWKRRPSMPKQVDHRERRETIARALWRVVEQRGIAHASVREVAQEAGISHGAVQHYFATREEMLIFAMD